MGMRIVLDLSGVGGEVEGVGDVESVTYRLQVCVYCTVIHALSTYN